jgi:hypothetical protein
MSHSWQLSLPQLAASTAAIVLLVSLVTVVGLRRWGGYGVVAIAPAQFGASDVNDRIWQRRQVIDYWNQRVELNKARWSPEMRETFDRNMQAVANSLDELKRNPHDEISEQMLNESLNDKLALLKEFSDL